MVQTRPLSFLDQKLNACMRLLIFDIIYYYLLLLFWRCLGYWHFFFRYKLRIRNYQRRVGMNRNFENQPKFSTVPIIKGQHFQQTPIRRLNIFNAYYGIEYCQSQS
jgi:hypothetical protein